MARESAKGHFVAPLSPSTPRLVVKREQCPLGPIIASPSTCSSKVYRRLNSGWDAHLGDSTARGVWSLTESHLYINFSGKKKKIPGPQEFRASLQGPDCTDSN